MFWTFKYRANWEDRLDQLAKEAASWENLYAKERVNNNALYLENQRLHGEINKLKGISHVKP